MNTEALIRLADKLDGVGPYADVGPVPPDKFEMTEWFRWSVLGPNIDPNGCGFAACAMGWACTDPWFQERGLRAHPMRYKMLPFVNDDQGFDAASKLFSISPAESEWLFSDYAYRDGACDLTPEPIPPAVVAQRIRQFVADGGMPSDDREAA